LLLLLLIPGEILPLLVLPAGASLVAPSSCASSVVAEDEAPSPGDLPRPPRRGVGGAPGVDRGEGDEGQRAAALLAAGGEVAPQLLEEPAPELVGVPALREAQQGRGGRGGRRSGLRRRLGLGSVGGAVGGAGDGNADRSGVRVRIL